MVVGNLTAAGLSAILGVLGCGRLEMACRQGLRRFCKAVVSFGHGIGLKLLG